MERKNGKRRAVEGGRDRKTGSRRSYWEKGDAVERKNGKRSAVEGGRERRTGSRSS